MLKFLGRGEGFTLLAVAMFVMFTVLVVAHRIDARTYLELCKWLGITFFSGGAVASFRDILQNGKS